MHEWFLDSFIFIIIFKEIFNCFYDYYFVLFNFVVSFFIFFAYVFEKCIVSDEIFEFDL